MSRVRHASKAVRLWSLIGLMGVVAAMAFSFGARWVTEPAGPTSVPWWVLGVLFAATEVFAVHVTFRRSSHSLSLSEIPLVVGLALTGPLGFVAARVLGAGVPLMVRERQRGGKLVFNVVHAFLEASLAVVVYRTALGDASVTSPRAWIAALVTVVAVDIVSACAIQGAIAIESGHVGLRELDPVLVTGLVGAVANTSVALLAVLVLCDQPQALVLLGALALVLFAAYRSHVVLSQRYGHLEQLYQFTRGLSSAVRLDAVSATVLGEARDLLRADMAELLLFSDEDRDGCHLRLAGADPAPQPVDVRDCSGTWWAPAALGESVLASRARHQNARSVEMVRAGLTDAMAAPLIVEASVIGVLVVANRLGEVTTFDADDLKLFEALANHAAVALMNGRLMEQLRAEVAVREHEALHDPLTDLPNRRSFRAEVDQALATREASSVAVALLDLDRFKEVNDTLGHTVGDKLLRLVGARLSSGLPAHASIARLGGDEFAILMHDVTDERDAIVAIDDLLRAFEHPFLVDDVSLTIGASAGVALAPIHGDDASRLLQRADVAMYQAKQHHRGVELYEPDRDRYSARWLSLVNELREVIDSGDLEVHYQPKAALATGNVVGVEALARWTSRHRGVVSPEEFIPIAEHTGLIRPLTRFVLTTALRDCAVWRRQGRELTVSVNLSSRSLLDPALVDDVRDALRQADLPPDVLVLELTENSVVENLDRAVAVLRELHDLGVQLSIDDFGSGYASLAYLKHLPVDEVKIDKSFVLDMATDVHDAAIVGSTVELLHRLGLRAVAEGVENEHVWGELAEMGCDVAQGYLLSRPVPADRFVRWLDARHPTAGGPRRLAAIRA